MKPLGWIGVLLIVLGAFIIVRGGLPYTKSSNEVEVGPLKVTAREKGLVPPLAGIAAVVIGGVLVFSARKKSA
ncbi:MAG: hypothetical protein H0T21_10330 [Gemmatimonadaceae bacterium]|nr:hypothetical protein [Gemmatimonadaceae bacterium]